MSKRGGVRVYKGRVYARVRFGKNERLEVRLPWAKTADEAGDRPSVIGELCDQLLAGGRRDLVKPIAHEAGVADTTTKLATVKKAVAAYVKMGAIVAPASMTTFFDVAEDWIDGSLRKKHPDHVATKKDFKIERGRLRRYIYPHVKDVPLAFFTKEDADRVMAALPTNRVKRSTTRRHVAQIMNRVLNLAVMPLGLIKHNPLPEGYLPRIDKGKMYTCLFPHEETKLLACKEVDEAFRLFFGILDREGMRVSELVDSEWWQWNLEVGTFTATKTKTDDPRFWALRPDVTRAMRLWKKRFGTTKRTPFADISAAKDFKLYLAQNLRASLETAGITRKELLESTDHTAMLRAHDLRATFVTVSLAEGKQETWIRDRTGHRTMGMIDRYRRTARQFVELKLGSLPDLVEVLGWGISRVIFQASGTDGEVTTTEDDSQFRHKDSNLGKRNQNPLSCH